MSPRVTVVVPTRNRARSLSSLLDALARQTEQSVEVVVVDDASNDETPSLLAAWQGEGRRFIRLDRPSGSYAARNAGWQAARGEIIAFTDDDCLPAPGWLALLGAGFAEGTAGVQGATLIGSGRVTPFTHQIEQTRGGPPYRTCNIAYRRTVLEAVGGFRPWRWYADNVLGYEAKFHGKIAFAPEAIVFHPPRPREWRSEGAWLERFRADAAHRAELRRLGVERVQVPGGALPLVLWVVRPVLHQAPAHLRALIRDPRAYTSGLRPLLQEKWALARALHRYCREERAMLPAGDTLVSVVVVTRERPSVLDGALAALDLQTYPSREVIVVDNGAGDARAVAERHAARYVSATGLTLGAARQAGVAAAEGGIIAFTDDDCLPEPDWLAALVATLEKNPAVRGVQGRTMAQPGPADSHAVHARGHDALFRTCNIAYRRTAIDAAGGFDPGFEGWFEDTDLGARVQHLGPIGATDRAVVIHRAMPRVPLTDGAWRRLLADETHLAARQPVFYRRARGRSVRSVMRYRWLIGSPLKTLLRALPRGLRHPHEYARLVRILVVERQALARVLYRKPLSVSLGCADRDPCQAGGEQT